MEEGPARKKANKKAAAVATTPESTSTFGLTTIGHSADVLDMPVDPNEPTYCLCHQVSYGEMIGCDNPDVIYILLILFILNSKNEAFILTLAKKSLYFFKLKHRTLNSYHKQHLTKYFIASVYIFYSCCLLMYRNNDHV